MLVLDEADEMLNKGTSHKSLDFLLTLNCSLVHVLETKHAANASVLGISRKPRALGAAANVNPVHLALLTGWVRVGRVWWG